MVTFIRRTVIFLFLGGLVGAFIYFNVTRPRVLVLHSYSADYAWTRDVNVGLMRIFDRHPNYAVRWHYMDTKRHPWPEFARAAGITARKVLGSYRPDVAIIVDDDAQQLAGKFFVGDPNLKIVHAGINGSAKPYGYEGAKNVTGILERKPVRAVRDVIVDLARRKGLTGPVRVMFLGDSSGSVKRDAAEMEHLDWAPLKFVGSSFVESWPAWQQAVLDAPAKADFIIVANYRKLTLAEGKEELIDAREVMPWTEKNSRIPVIGTNGFNVEDGAALAIGTSPFEQGEVAAEMAVDIIDNRKSPSAIPWRQTEQFTVSIREGGMREKQLMLPAVYEAFARVMDSFIPATGSDGITQVTATRSDAAEAPAIPPAQSGAGAGESVAVTAAAGIQAVSKVETVQADVPAAPGTEAAPPDVEAEAAQAANAPGAAAKPVVREIGIRTGAQTRVEVLDAKGNKLIARQVAGGKTVTAKGTAPFKIQLGRTDGVQITLDGVAVPVVERALTIE